MFPQSLNFSSRKQSLLFSKMIKSDFISHQKDAGCQKRDLCTRDAFLKFYGSPVRLISPYPSPIVCTDVRTYGRTDVRSYADVITKFSRLDGLPIFLTHGALLARFARQSSAITIYKILIKEVQQKKYVFTKDNLQKKCFFTYALQYQDNFQYI